MTPTKTQLIFFAFGIAAVLGSFEYGDEVQVQRDGKWEDALYYRRMSAGCRTYRFSYLHLVVLQSLEVIEIMSLSNIRKKPEIVPSEVVQQQMRAIQNQIQSQVRKQMKTKLESIVLETKLVFIKSWKVVGWKYSDFGSYQGYCDEQENIIMSPVQPNKLKTSEEMCVGNRHNKDTKMLQCEIYWECQTEEVSRKLVKVIGLPDGSEFTEGQRVESLFEGKWYAGAILGVSCVQGKTVYDIKWDDGCKTTKVSAYKIRQLAPYGGSPWKLLVKDLTCKPSVWMVEAESVHPFSPGSHNPFSSETEWRFMEANDDRRHCAMRIQ